MTFDYSKIKGKYSLLWKVFKNSLLESIKEIHIKKFEEAWKSRTERTCFYFESLLPKIAMKMNLELDKEYPFRVDATFYVKAASTSKVPIIFLESENDAFSSHAEVIKLCLLNAPLKVLVIL